MMSVFYQEQNADVRHGDCLTGAVTPAVLCVARHPSSTRYKTPAASSLSVEDGVEVTTHIKSTVWMCVQSCVCVVSTFYTDTADLALKRYYTSLSD